MEKGAWRGHDYERIWPSIQQTISSPFNAFVVSDDKVDDDDAPSASSSCDDFLAIFNGTVEEQDLSLFSGMAVAYNRDASPPIWSSKAPMRYIPNDVDIARSPFSKEAIEQDPILAARGKFARDMTTTHAAIDDTSDLTPRSRLERILRRGPVDIWTLFPSSATNMNEPQHLSPSPPSPPGLGYDRAPSLYSDRVKSTVNKPSMGIDQRAATPLEAKPRHRGSRGGRGRKSQRSNEKHRSANHYP